MSAATYSSGNVIKATQEEVVPLQLPYNQEPQAADYNVKWTPALFVIDPQGVEHHSTVGFLPPEEFIAFLMLGIAKSYFDLEKLAQAHEYLQRVIEDYPRSLAAPEAVYLRGVTRYKMTQTVAGLVEAYEELQERYPGSDWARRSEPYRLLKEAA